MRLIDADELQKLFNEVSTSLLRKGALTGDEEHMVRAFLMVTEMIQDAPTICPDAKMTFTQNGNNNTCINNVGTLNL